MNSKTARKPAAMTLRNLFLGLLIFSLSAIPIPTHAQGIEFLKLRPRDSAAEQREDMLDLQEEMNRELRRQTQAIEDATATAKKARDDADWDKRRAERKHEQAVRELEPATWKPTAVPEYPLPPKAPAAPPTLTLRNPNDPNQFPTFVQFMAAHKGEDNLSIVHKYRDESSLHLLKNAEYDDELVDEINGQLFQHAVEQGWIDATDQQKAMAQYFGPASKADAQDASLINLQSLYDGDTAAGKAASLYKALLSDHVRNTYADQAEYQAKLENAKQQFKSIVTTDKILAARRAAVDRGDIPFSVLNDSIYLGKEIKKCAGDDAALARMFEAYPNLDRTMIGAVRKKLSKP